MQKADPVGMGDGEGKQCMLLFVIWTHAILNCHILKGLPILPYFLSEGIGEKEEMYFDQVRVLAGC